MEETALQHGPISQLEALEGPCKIHANVYVQGVSAEKAAYCIMLHECKICSVKFTHKHDLSGHIDLVHEKKARYKCDICDAKFSHKMKLKIHIASVHKLPVHEEDKSSVICELCNKKLSSKAYLKLHISFVHERKKAI